MRAILIAKLLVCVAMTVPIPPFVVTDRAVPRFVVTERVAKPAAKAAPSMVCITASWCGPCKLVKADDKAGKFPCEMQYLDIDERDPPIKVDSLPTFYWVNLDGKAYQYPPPDTPLDKAGYVGAVKLVAIWKATQPKGG